MKDNTKFSINGVEVTEKDFLKTKVNQLNMAGIDHVIEPFLEEINHQYGCIEYQNNIGVSSVVVHNVSRELSKRIQKEIEQNRLDY